MAGGGYIGLEAAEQFRSLGIDTTLVHRREDLHRSFEKEISDIIKDSLKERVGLILEDHWWAWKNGERSVSCSIQR